METVIVILFMVLGLSIIYIPWAFYGKAKKFTGRVLGAAYPRFRWIDKGFLIYNAVIWLGSIALLGMIGIRQDIDPTTMVYTGQFAAIAAFHGLFAALVAVCPVPV